MEKYKVTVQNTKFHGWSPNTSRFIIIQPTSLVFEKDSTHNEVKL